MDTHDAITGGGSDLTARAGSSSPLSGVVGGSNSSISGVGVGSWSPLSIVVRGGGNGVDAISSFNRNTIYGDAGSPDRKYFPETDTRTVVFIGNKVVFDIKGRQIDFIELVNSLENKIKELQDEIEKIKYPVPHSGS
jgi:hypothetical protein